VRMRPGPAQRGPAPVEADREPLHRWPILPNLKTDPPPRCFTGAPKPFAVDARNGGTESQPRPWLLKRSWGPALYARCRKTVAEPEPIRGKGKASHQASSGLKSQLEDRARRSRLGA